ncbi:unnamed protein product [Timema podura]|uniref:C3H1-type domain-containing protein n=1 Tax=Timema podura TaxID=61482 RepID=A0ABN7NSI0_TIMPD|nr:unnamed protein product [Timema podura]
MPPSKKVQGAVKRPTLVKKGKKDAIKLDKVKIRDNESTSLLKKKHLANDVPKSNLKTEKIVVPAIAPKCTPSKASKKEFYVEQVDINLSNNRSHNTRSQKLFDKPTKKRNSSVDITSKKKKRKLERTTPHSYEQYDNESVLSEMSHATMFAHECETSPKQNSSELFCFEEDQAQITQFNINTSSPLKIEIPSDYSPLVFSANTSKNLSSPSSSDIKASPSKPRQRSRFIRNNSQSSDRSSESTGRTRKFFPRISKELSTSKESLVSSKSSYSNVKPECSNSDIDDGLISDISLNDSISLNRTMICSPYVQVQVMSDELLHHWSKTTENKSSCASLKGKVSNVNSSPSLVNTTKPTTKQPLSIKNKIDIVESSLPTTKKCLVTSKKYVTTSSPKQSSAIENKNLYSPSFDILNESLVPDQHKVGKGNSLSNICMPSSPTLNNAKLSLSQLTKSEAQVDSKKVFTHNHDVIKDKEIGDSLQRRSRRHLSESSSDSRISMSRDIDEVESVSKMSSEAQVDSKKIVTHSHDVMEDKEMSNSLRRRLRRNLSESSSDSRLSISRDIDEVESLSKISSQVSPTKQKIAHKLNFPYQQINLNVAEVKHLDLKQIALCDTPESISNNSSTTSKINAPSILKDDEEKNFCHETETNSYKSLHLVSTYDSDQVNTTIPAQKQTVMLKALQTPASKYAVGETPSIVCEDISLKLSKSAEALGSDQATSKQNLVQVEGHKVATSDDKTPVTIKSTPQCTSSLDCNSRATATTSNKRFRLKRNFSSNLSKSNTVQTSSDMYPIEQEKLCFQKTTEKLIPSVQLSPSTPTSMSDPAVSGHLRDEDNESDEDLDAISLFAETDIGFEQRPAEVRPKNIHPDNPFAKSDSDSDISNNSDNESRPLELPVPEFMHYLNKEKESHQTITNIPLNDKVDSNVDFPRWRNDNYQECDQSSCNENDGSECSIEVPFGEELDSHNTSSLTAEDRFDTCDDAHSMAEEREFETENENKYFAEEEDNLEDLHYNGTANNDSPNLPDKAAEQHCETNIAHYMSGYLRQHGITEDVTPMGYHSPSQHSSSSCRKPQEGKFCFTFLKHGNCKKYPHNCNYNHCVPHHSLSAPIEAGNYLLFTYSKGFNHASNFILTSLIKEIIDKNETNINRNDQELWDILVKMLLKCGKPLVSLLNTLINTFVSIISDLPLKSFDSAISLLLIVAKYNSLHPTWSSVKALIWATDLKGTVDVVTKYINVCNTLSTPDKEFIVDVYKYFIELNPAIKNCEDISVRKFASVLQKNGLTHFANNLKIIAPKAFGLKPSEHKPGPSFTATIKKCDESQQNSSGSMSGLMEMGPHLPQERRSNVLLPPAKVPIPPKRLNNTPRFSAESINNTFVKHDSQVPNTFSDTDLRNRLQISHNSSASSQECSPQEKLTSVRAELSTQHNNRNMNMKRVTRRGEQPSPLDSIPDQIDHSLHSQNITRVPKLTNSNPHNVHLSNANISSNSTFQERSSDDLDYADTMSSYVHNNEERFNEPLSYTDNINKPFYSISSTKHPIGNTTFGPKLFFPPGIRAGLNIRDSGGKYWEDEDYSTHASSLPLPDSSRETFQDMAQLSNFSTQRPFEFQGKYGPNFQCPQRPQLPPQLLSNKPPQGPKLHNRVRRRRQSQTQWHPIHEPPNSNCGPVNEDECRRVFEQEWNLTLKNLKGGDYRSVNARLNNWKNRAERNEFCARVYQELIRNGESAAPNFRRLVESAGNPHLFSNRRDFQK